MPAGDPDELVADPAADAEADPGDENAWPQRPRRTRPRLGGPDDRIAEARRRGIGPRWVARCRPVRSRRRLSGGVTIPDDPGMN